MNNFKLSFKTEAYFLFCFIVLALLDSQVLRQNGIVFPSGSRHAILIMSFVFAAVINRVRIVAPKSFVYFLLPYLTFSAYMLINYQFNLISSVLGFIFTSLFIFIFILSYSFSISRQTFLNFMMALSVLIFISAIPTFFHGVLFGNFRATPTIFRELGAHGFILNIGVIASLYSFFETKKKIFLFIIACLTIFIFATTLKKSILELLLIIFIYLFFVESLQLKLKLFISFFLLVFLIPVVILIGDSMLENIAFNIFYFQNTGVEEHVRFGMYLASYNIASDYFPFGSGFGTFGSFGSIFGGFYSPLYDEYGVSAIGLNSLNDVLNSKHTLLDTFWPHIFAELGVLGSILFILLFTYPIFFSLLSGKLKSNPLSFVIISLVTINLLDGLALFTPEIPIFIFMIFGISGLACRIIANEKKML